MMYRFREPVSGLTHLAGAVLAGFGLVWLVYETWHTPAKMVSMLVYGLSLILLYSASSALHLVRASESTLLWLRRCDHAAIYILIAGSYTPVVYNILNGQWRWGVLGIVWVVALAGATFKLLYLHGYSHYSTLTYLVLGWSGIVLVPEAAEYLPVGAALLILGSGLAYTLGAVIYAIEKPNFHPHFGAHEIWHLLVMMGSTLHFVMILLYIV